MFAFKDFLSFTSFHEIQQHLLSLKTIIAQKISAFSIAQSKLHKLTTQATPSASGSDSQDSQAKDISPQSGVSKAEVAQQGTLLLRHWFYSHLSDPYPSQAEKQLLSEKTGLSVKQINNWFVNYRGRRWIEGKTRKFSTLVEEVKMAGDSRKQNKK